mgnify:FL=1
MPSGGARPGAGRPRKPIEISTARSIFAPEQREQLEASPYVASVTEKTISFTCEFKEMFWQRYTDGEMPDAILRDAGIDPEAVGVSRIWGLIGTLRKQKAQGLEFNDGREPHLSEQTVLKKDMPRQPRFPKSLLEMRNSAEIAKLSHAVAYLMQEMEFIKKIIAAANGGKSK